MGQDDLLALKLTVLHFALCTSSNIESYKIKPTLARFYSKNSLCYAPSVQWKLKYVLHKNTILKYV